VSIRLHGLRHAIRLPRVDRLAGLLDLLEHARVVDGGLGRYVCGLGVQGDVVGLDACFGGKREKRVSKVLLSYERR
jgi:hypothetical protein